MPAILAVLLEIAKWLFFRARSVAGSVAILTAFGGIGSGLLLLRQQIITLSMAHFPEKLICYLQVFGLFTTLDIVFSMLGSALAVRLTRIIAKQLERSLNASAS